MLPCLFRKCSCLHKDSHLKNKKPGSKAYERFDKYNATCTIGAASAAGASSLNQRNGLLEFVNELDNWDAKHAPGKRPSQEGTPDREASERANVAATSSQALQQNMALEPHSLEVDKIEMSPAALQTLRMMMRGGNHEWQGGGRLTYVVAHAHEDRHRTRSRNAT